MDGSPRSDLGPNHGKLDFLDNYSTCNRSCTIIWAEFCLLGQSVDHNQYGKLSPVYFYKRLALQQVQCGKCSPSRDGCYDTRCNL